MTRQYLVGELSELLGLLEASVPPGSALSVPIVSLRREAEQLAPAELTGVTQRAMALANALCWRALSCGDATAFARRAAITAGLYEFGVCAGLLEEE